jgi:hypothetical protein
LASLKSCGVNGPSKWSWKLDPLPRPTTIKMLN